MKWPKDTDKPTPNKNNTCSRSCAFFFTDHMPGWPSFNKCLKWDEKKHGECRQFRADNTLCMPFLVEKAKSK